jgi:transposase
LVEQQLRTVGGVPYIPFKTNSVAVTRSKKRKPSATWTRLYHYFALNREDFLAHYHKRSNVETTFSMMKRVFGGSVRAKTETAQASEVLLKVICHNIRCLIHAMHELGIEPMLGGLSDSTAA